MYYEESYIIDDLIDCEHNFIEEGPFEGTMDAEPEIPILYWIIHCIECGEYSSSKMKYNGPVA